MGFFCGTAGAMAIEIGIPFARVPVLCGGASGKSINEFSVKSLVLNLEDIEWKNLVMHWSRPQDEVLSMKSHAN